MNPQASESQMLALLPLSSGKCRSARRFLSAKVESGGQGGRIEGLNHLASTSFEIGATRHTPSIS